MTSALTTADAYARWLNIPPAQHPPHHYALLGLPLYTSDAQAIYQAYQQRAGLVGQQLGGPHAATALKLLGELAAAQACLLNEETRAAYNRRLGEQAGAADSAANLPVGAAATSAAAAGLQRPAPRGKAEPPTGAPPANEVAAPPASHDGHHEIEEPSSVVPWLVGGVCAGLLAVAVLGIVLFAFPKRSPTGDIARNTRASQRDGDRESTGAGARRKSDRGSRRETQRDRDATLIVKVDDDVLGERVAPLTTEPERLDSSIIGPPTGTGDTVVDVVGDDDEADAGEPADEATDSPPDESSASPPTETPAATASPVAKLPRAIALPSRGAAGGSGLLAQLPIKDPSSVKLALDTSGVAGGDKFALAAEEAGDAPGERVWPVQQIASSGAPRAVGEYALAGDELTFRWAESALASDDALANAALAVSLDGKEVFINLRSPDAVAPLKLAVDSGAVTTSAKIDDPPPQAKLFLSLAAQDEEFPAHQLQPEEAVAAGHDVDVIFGEATDPYRLALRVSLAENGAGGIRIEARPMFQNADEGLKWDYFRPKAIAQTLAQRKQQEALLDARLAQLQQQFGRNSLQLQQAMELYNRQATEVQTRVLALEKIHALCEEINAKGALNYRVFAKLGEREVDLVDSTLGISLPAADLPAEASPDDPDGIVGPPTAP